MFVCKRNIWVTEESCVCLRLNNEANYSFHFELTFFIAVVLKSEVVSEFLHYSMTPYRLYSVGLSNVLDLNAIQMTFFKGKYDATHLPK